MAEKKSGKTVNTKKEALLALDYVEPTIREAEEEETAIDMAKKQLDALGVKYEMSGNKFRPFKAIYKPSNEDLDALYDQEYELTRIYQNDKSEENWKKLSQIREKGKQLEEFEDIVDLFNLGSAVKQAMSEAKFRSGLLSGKDFINAKLKNYPKAVAKVNQLINMIGEDKFTIEMAEWIFDFFNNASFESPVNEATKDEETKFHKRLDKLVHDTFGKRKSELEEVNLKQSKLSSAEYQKAKKLKNFKASDWKWNANEDLYIKVNEGKLTEAKSFTIDSESASDSDKITDFLTKNDISFKKVGSKIKISLDRDTPKASSILSKLKSLSKFNELNEGELTEANVPSNIRDFAKRKGVLPLVNKVAKWAEAVGARIAGGTAIGKNYSTLVLDLDYKQQGEVRIDTDNNTITLFDEPVRNYNEFQRVYADGQGNNLEEVVSKVLSKIKEAKSTPCWKGYEQIGMKEKDGRQVPNCVPKK
jgi:hypothetical protein